MNTRALIAMAAAVTVLSGCATTPHNSEPNRTASAVETADRNSLDTLAAWMTGSFTSAAQAAADPENYFAVTLHMRPVWTDRDDGPWLYVEQAIASAQDRPYRQRVYRLAEARGAFTSTVYELPSPGAFVGAWRDTTPFASITPSDLDERDGCTIYLHRESGAPDAAFVGATDARACTSTLRGASYATSEVTITDGLLVSWDRGFNDAGEHVWGATAGGYEFVRLAD